MAETYDVTLNTSDTPLTAEEFQEALRTYDAVCPTVTDKLTGSLAGRSGPVCELRYVLATVEGGSAGEELRTTGFDKIYPPGIRVGRILGLERDESSPIFRRIFVEPYVRFNTLDVVAVLTGAPGGAR